jgi:putative hydrolase of the HAD superfamily
MDSRFRGNDNFEMKYKAVIFDLFGTLVDIYDRAGYYSVLREMMSVLKTPPDDFIKLWRNTNDKRATGGFRTLEENIEYIGHELKINFSKNQIERACKIRMDFVARALEPKPDAIETLAQLKSSGYKIGLISNCSTEPPVIWPDTPFAPFFNTAIFSSTCGLQKPDPRIFKLATKNLGVKPEECLYIGDGDGNELTGAAGVGMRPVLIRHSGADSANALHSDNYEGQKWQGSTISALKEILSLLE